MALIGALNILLGLNAAGVAAGAKKSRASLKGIEDQAHTTAHAVEALKGALELAGVGLGAYEAVEFLKSSYEAYHEAEQQQRKLEAVLETTGHAAGFTSEQLGRLNAQLQASTNFDDDAIAGGEAVLATFKQIQGVQFTQAAEAMLDLSAVMEQDLQSSAVQLGKALNDPIRGITALRRVGVSFTAEQERLIKSMVESGDSISAQQVILAELKSEFGGAAAAMRSETVGLANDWGDLKEAIGSLFDNDLVKDGLKELASLVRDLATVVKTASDGWKMLGHWMHNDTSAMLADAQKADAQFDEFKGAAGRLAFVATGTYRGPAAEEGGTPAAHGHRARAALAGGEGDLDEQADSAGSAYEALDKLVAKLREERQSLGLTGTAREIAALQLKGLTDAELAEARALAAHNAAAKEAAEHAQALQKDIASLTQKLQLQAATFGMSADEAQLFELRLRGATEAQLAAAKAAQQQIAHLTAQKEAQAALREEQERMAGEAKSVWEQTRTPLEKYESQLAHLQRLRDAGALDPETHRRAERQARGQLASATAPEWVAQYEAAVKRLEDLHAHNRISDETYHANQQRLRDQFEAGPPDKKTGHEAGPEAAASREAKGNNPALLAGSAEAYHAIAKFQTPKQAVEKQSLAELRAIRRALADQAKAERKKQQPHVIPRF